MMTKLRVLLVDDNPDDRALVLRELRREFRVEAQEVGDLESLDSAIQAGGFDLVITDYQLQQTNGLVVLRRVREKIPDIPVVMFTGTGSEEIAVEAMKSGLDDYVLKSTGGYGRLTAAVKLALQGAEHRRELKIAEERYKELFETVPIGLFRCTPTGVLLDANTALANMLGMSRERLLASPFAELHAKPHDYARWRNLLERHGAVAFIGSELRKAGGQSCWAEIHAKAIRDRQSGQIYYEGSVEDVTARKRAETERERLIADLQEALSKVKSLTGLLPICAGCKKIRDDEGQWNELEPYIESHSEAEFTHGFCPECAHRLYPEVMVDIDKI